MESRQQPQKKLISIIGGQPFYRDKIGTFFPFGGIYIDDSDKPLHSLMPRHSSFDLLSNKFDCYFDAELVQQVKEDFLKSMGNMHALILSMSIGGGVWRTSDGIQLAMFINDKYRDLVVKLQKKYKAQIHAVLNAVEDKALNENKYINIILPPSEEQTAEMEAGYQVIHVVNVSEINQKLAEAALIVKAGNLFSGTSRPEKIDYRLSRLFSKEEAETGIKYQLPVSVLKAENHLDFLQKKRAKVLGLLTDYQATLPENDDSTIALKAIVKEISAIFSINPQPASIQRITDELEVARQEFIKKLPEMEKHREPTALFILKMIGHALLGGLVSKFSRGTFSFWKTDAELMSEKAIRTLSKISFSQKEHGISKHELKQTSESPAINPRVAN